MLTYKKKQITIVAMVWVSGCAVFPVSTTPPPGGVLIKCTCSSHLMMIHRHYLSPALTIGLCQIVC